MFKINFSDNINPDRFIKKRLRSRYVQELERLAKGVVYVGFPESAKNDEGLTIAKYARWNNYGTFSHDENGNTTSRIPARPFFTEGFFFEKYKERRQALAKELIRMLRSGKASYKDVLGMVGTEAVNNVRDAIQTGPWVPNAPSTLARKLAKSKGKKAKEGVKPLIDTGDMIGAVTYKVEEQ